MSYTMAEPVPSITLTDPQNRAAAPQSPIRGPNVPSIPPAAEQGYGWAGVARSSRPETPKHTSKGSISRGDATSNSPSWSSPSRLIRSLSNNAIAMNSNLMTTSREGSVSASATNPKEEIPAMDPLSQHLMNRTNTVPKTGDRSPSRDRQPSDHSESASIPNSPPPSRAENHEHAQKDLKKGVKAVSFLSRLMHVSKKKDVNETAADDESVSNDGRPEGNDAKVFAQSIGYNPRHPQPPGYIKVRSKHKKQRDFDRLFLAQELDYKQTQSGSSWQNSSSTNKLRRKSSASTDADTVWAMEFSRDGKHLATAGAGMILRIWAVLSSPEDRQKLQSQEMSDYDMYRTNSRTEHLSAPVFHKTPVREYEGHTSTILDISWSKNNFILSSSMDKTVRLWHVSRAECLCTFQHTDFVPSIAFHPKDDRFFLTGSLDSKLRLWNIPDKSVAFSVKVPDMITAVGFTPDGKYVMAGCLSGLCVFYETDGLKYQSQIHVKSTRGQNVKGSKITGIQGHVAASGEVKILITSNDSRIRLYNFRDKSLELKFRGNTNNCSQIRATLSEDGRYVVCGSEDRKAYIWSLGPAEGEKRDKRPVEMFEAHNTITTAVCFAPAKTKQLLSRSEDPVYDLCNPPPVSLQERVSGSPTSSKPPTENGSTHANVSAIASAQPADAADGRFEKPREPASYLARTHHKNGNIIVTADYAGRIKVFRQDCAWSKRRQYDDWDRSSIFSKRNGAGSGGRLSRTNSITTRASQRSLQNQGYSASTSSIPREPRTSTSTQRSSDRILSWRQNIDSTPSLANSLGESSQGRRSVSSHSRTRKPKSGIEPLTIRTDSSAVSTTRTQSTTTPKTETAIDAKATRARVDSHDSQAGIPTAPKPSQSQPDTPQSPRKEDGQPTPPSSRSSNKNPLNMEGDRSYVFWDTAQWKDRIAQMNLKHRDQQPPQGPSQHHVLTPVRSAEDNSVNKERQTDGTREVHDPTHLDVDNRRLRPSFSSASGQSFVSKLSDERSSRDGEDDDDDEEEFFDDARER
ncbi:putative wd repeat-containing protein c3h5.08c [Acrodontium crateriforme]|uniref:Wd repeat-containing protein c3h5.08c n=1 Tax=Acrodontium crateriforme TaxID=150365 RepID=A0AAQ3RCX3_9PEZI|nr:putative wd repeat-containing protein c3h5.08c [Acrodontium crateriforme]